jgi:hypothetical protein
MFASLFSVTNPPALASIPLVPNPRRVETIVVRQNGRELADRLADGFAAARAPYRAGRSPASICQSRGMMSGKRPTATICSYSAAPPVCWSGRVTIGSDVGYGIGWDGGLAAVVRPMPLQPGSGFVGDDFQIAKVESVRPGVAGKGQMKPACEEVFGVIEGLGGVSGFPAAIAVRRASVVVGPYTKLHQQHARAADEARAACRRRIAGGSPASGELGRAQRRRARANDRLVRLEFADHAGSGFHLDGDVQVRGV